MNTNLRQKLIKMSKILIYGIILQTFVYTFVLAVNSEAQEKSVNAIKVKLDLKSPVILEKVFRHIEMSTDFHFSYVDEHLYSASRVVNMETKQLTLGDLLKDISRQTNLQFRRVNDHIFIAKKKSGSDPVTEEIQVDLTVNGKVTDGNGEPLPGASVIVLGTTNGTITDLNGEYSIECPNESVLVFSYVGYESQQIPIGDRTTINVQLILDSKQLEEVVVVGYGTVQKSDLTGSVSKVSGEELENIPSSRVDQLLQGRAPGVSVTSVSGEPGAATSIRIRGGNSIQGNNEPLWVIDGIIVGQDFDLNNINANDIESIEVLKDATALSIYGTRGANGVILVSTKSGINIPAGDMQVNANFYGGIQSIVESVDFLNGPQHAEYSNEDAEFRGVGLPFDISNVPDVDWIDQITQNAPIYNADLGISGTSDNNNVSYYLSGNFFKQEGIIRSTGIRKYIFRSNVDYKLSDVVKTGVRLNVANVRKENIKTNLNNLFDELFAARGIYNDDGSFTFENPVSASLQANPEADVSLKDDHSLITNLLGSIYLEITPSNNLTIRSSINPEFDFLKRNRFNPGALPENMAINDGGDASVFNSTSISFINENTITYETEFTEDHRLNVLGGFTFQKFKNESSLSEAYQLSNDITGFNNLAFGSNPLRNIVGSDFNAFQLVSWLGRVNYVFKDKYLFTFVGRVDGSSRFAEGNKYGFFPSAAVAWRLSEEEFIKNLDVFDNLKLRSSYGVTGSQAIESFRTLALLETANTTFNGVEQAGVTLGRPENPNLSWETTRQFDIGLEMAFLQGRLNVELDYYIKNTEDLLLNVQIPRQTGFESKLQNLGEVQNRGFEALISSVNIDKNDFKWTTYATFWTNKNEVVDLGGVDFADIVTFAGSQAGPSGRLILGQPAPVFVGVNYLGTWKSQEEIDASGQVGQDVGGPRFEDINGDQQVSEDDFVVLGSPQPDFTFGLQNSISFKSFHLDFFLQGTYGNEVFNRLTTFAFFGRAEKTKYAEVLNRWTPENPTSDIPRAGAVEAASEVKNNSEMVEDGSHIRLKNVMLTYDLPVQKWGLEKFSNISLYFSGNNLLIFSKFRLTDPETSMFGRSNIALGFSEGEYPTSRVLSLGIKASF